MEHILFLTELWHLLDVSAVAGHGVVLAALLFAILYEGDKFCDVLLAFLRSIVLLKKKGLL